MKGSYLTRRSSAASSQMRRNLQGKGGHSDGGTHTPGTPVGFRLGDPMPEGLSVEDQEWWHAMQKEKVSYFS